MALRKYYYISEEIKPKREALAMAKKTTEMKKL
jgi:hypothetical protein